jgi:aldehyde dehydrogenase (NAD+)
MTTNAVARYSCLVGGEERSVSGETFPAVDASTGEHLADLTRGGEADVDAAVAAAKAALPGWAATPVEERSRMLLALADAVEANIDRLALLDARDIGRRIFETRLDHLTAIGQYRFFAAAAITHTGWNRSIPNGWAVSKREPIGVCGQIIPWNVPGIMASFKIAPAVAAGNTVVLKPDENASLSTMELCRLAQEIFPPGVINAVTGFGEEAGAALTAHPGVAKIAFTGSAEVGRIVAAAGASRLVPVSLELGGKSPNIVFPDVDDIDAVVDQAAFAVTWCNGQSCLAGTRLFVHDDIYDTVMEKLVAAFGRLRVGAPTSPDTALSCMVSETQGRKVLDFIETGKAEGGNLVTGGERVGVEGHEHGWFIEPTIFEVENSMTIAQQEIFGPVLSVLRWNDVDRMIAEANDVKYGLAAGVYTSNLKNALNTADRLQAGSVWVNQYVNLVDGSPFGGYKESGYGREVCAETLSMYSQLKSVTLVTDVPEPWYAV